MNNQETGLHAENAALREELAYLRQQVANCEQARLMVETAPIGLLISNPVGQCVESNQAMQVMLGYSGQELRDMSFAEFTHPDDLMIEMPMYEAIIAGERSQYEVAKRYIRKDGQIIHVNLRIAAVRTPDGAVDFFIGTIEDITQRKQAEEEHQRFVRIIETTTDIVSIIDIQGQVLFFNHAGQQFFQATDPTRMNIEQLYPAWALQRLKEHGIPTALRDGSSRGEIAIRDPDGDEVPVSQVIIAHKNAADDITYLSTITRDITEQKQAEELLRENQERLQFALEGSGSGVWDWKIATNEVVLSDRYRELLGFGPGELDDSMDSWVSNIHPDDLSTVQQYLQDYLEGRTDTYAVEHRLRRGDGTWQWVLSRGKVIMHDDTGQPMRLTGTIMDISKQKQAEQEREALQQQIIEAQRESLRELSTPIIPITDTVMIMPLIGTIDSQRAQMVMEALLEGVAQHQAELVILDITGVSVVDTQVAQAFIQAAQAVRLLGARVMLTGIQPQIAQTLVHLGADLSSIITQGSLQSGIATALGR